MASVGGIGESLRPQARQWARRLGYEVHRIPEGTEPPEIREVDPFAGTIVLDRLLDQIKPGVMIDVGANIGQFANQARTAGFEGELISFEPQPDEHALLGEIAAKDPRWRVGPRVALGDETGVAPLHVSGNSQSSSLREMLELHLENAPDSRYVGEIETPVVRLDDALDELAVDATGGLLKIDTQGFEFEVLRGAPRTIAAVSAVWLELSLAPLYAGAAATSQIVALLAEHGFELSHIGSGFRALDGGMLQFDGGFTRHPRMSNLDLPT